jgi:hypothetical protein
MLRSACCGVDVSVLVNGAQGCQDFCRDPTGRVIFPAVLHGEIHPGPLTGLLTGVSQQTLTDYQTQDTP